MVGSWKFEEDAMTRRMSKVLQRCQLRLFRTIIYPDPCSGMTDCRGFPIKVTKQHSHHQRRRSASYESHCGLTAFPIMGQDTSHESQPSPSAPSFRSELDIIAHVDYSLPILHLDG